MSIKRVGFIVAAVLVLGSGVAYANDTTQQPDLNSDDYNFSLAGSGACQSNGAYLVTWTITNVSTAPYTNSNPAMTYDGGSVDALASKTLTQTENGTASATFSKSVTGSWNTDADDNKTVTATVILETPCSQPVQNFAPDSEVETIPSPFSPPVPGFSGK